MENNNKYFVELMIKKSKEKSICEVKDPFSNLRMEDIEKLTKEIMEKKK